MKQITTILTAIAVLLISCNEDRVVYEIEKETIYQSSSEKKNLKTAQEFISLAYVDIFGADIPSSVVEEIGVPYAGWGDKKLLEDLIIRNFINDPAADIPGNQEMRDDVSKFVDEAYLRFFNRNPDEFEQWKLKQMIEDDPDLTPDVIYYAMLTSQEYRYY